MSYIILHLPISSSGGGIFGQKVAKCKEKLTFPSAAFVNSQLVKPKFGLYRLSMVIIVVLLLISTFLISFHLAKMSDPYIREVLSLQGNVSRGYEIFQINCAACHGQFADGIVGPSLEDVSHRKSRISLIEQVISGKTPPMPKFQPDTQAMADLLVYLENLSKK
ncbi:MAG: cytochrome c [Chroococcales cyanobacterium metabat2.561]|uniref:Cytochrome c n=1 Tax=Microcystis aeruginosa Ma_SC_T_19800800_S464 TaxID=2486257 RepID=A0A552DU85_MICAE|nr:MAG: cytochrome c [Chroococcales cyanobacterium metabat2.561]TRU25733.1 MAG: cytochrome c [Microcystis aeruginosa Ma_SC_T_19800800_S464]